MTTNSRLLQGSLRDFGLVEVLQMMELGSMTGALRLKHSTGRTGIIYFSEGKMANCSELDAGALTLGDVLQQLGMTTSQQIEQAFTQELQDAFGKPIGERLVAMGANWLSGKMAPTNLSPIPMPRASYLTAKPPSNWRTCA